MNIVLVSHKVLASKAKATLESAESANLLAAIDIVKPDTVDTIVGYTPDVIIFVRGVPFRVKASFEDIVGELHLKLPSTRIIYVYGEVADRQDYMDVSSFLATKGICDIMQGDFSEDELLHILANPHVPKAVGSKTTSPAKPRATPKPKTAAVVSGAEANETSHVVETPLPKPKKPRAAPKPKTVERVSEMEDAVFPEELDSEDDDFESADNESLLIGIGQLHHRNGSTYTALELTTMLVAHGNSACVIISDEGVCDVIRAKEGKGCVDAYYHKDINHAIRNYTYIIYDYGLLDEENKQEFKRCDVKIMMCCPAEWNSCELETYMSISRQSKEVNYCFFPISRNKFVRLYKQYAKEKYKIHRIKTSNDWSLPCEDNCAVYTEIIKSYLGMK